MAGCLLNFKVCDTFVPKPGADAGESIVHLTHAVSPASILYTPTFVIDTPPENRSDLAHVTQMVAQLSATVNELSAVVARMDEHSLRRQHQDAVAHHGVACACCGLCPVVGVRYKCMNCESVDLCSACEEACAHDGAHRHPLFLKIRRPLRVMHEANWASGAAPTREAKARPTDAFEPEGAAESAAVPRYVLRFVHDVTIEDGALIAAGACFTKVWRVENTGSVAWPPDLILCPCDGSQIEYSSARIPIRAAQPGEQVDVAIDLRAPKKAGTYNMECQFVSERHGWQPGLAYVWVKIRVEEQACIGVPLRAEAETRMIAPSPSHDPARVHLPSASPAPSPHAVAESQSAQLAELAKMGTPHPRHRDCGFVRSGFVMRVRIVTVTTSAGFADLELNAKALAAAGGDLARAVEHLVAAEKPQQIRQS